MFNILSRLRPIHIDAFTFNEEVYKFYSPKNSKDYIPNWWKSLPASYTHDANFPQVQFSTMKKCTGVIEIFKSGFIIPLWSDLALTLKNTEGAGSYGYQFADNTSVIEAHPTKQYEGFTDKHTLQHLKLVTPWRLREKTGVKFVCMQPTWSLQNLNSDITILPGISDFKYQDSTNIQMLVRYPTYNLTTSLLINVGTPMVHMIPMSDRPIKITTHLVDRVKYNDMGNSGVTFSGAYLQRKKMIDQQPTCPFKKWL
jgi:hypothetical protein